MLPQEFLIQVRMYAPEPPPPALLSQIAYVEDPQLDDTYWNDTNGDFREAVCCEMVKHFDMRDRTILRYLLEQEIACMDVNESIDENTRRCVDMLAQLREAEDALLLWEAKRSTFDSYIGVDGRALVAAGVEKTLTYLNALAVGSEDQDEAIHSLIEEIEEHKYVEGDVEAYLQWFDSMWRKQSD